jgi:hypothetical protein
MNYIVYQTTNVINDRIYVGIHKQFADQFDGYLGSGILLARAVEKYGRDNFVRITLHECDTWDEARAVERQLVDVNFVSRDDTYNIAIGGQGGDTLAGVPDYVRQTARSKATATRAKTSAARRLLNGGSYYSADELECVTRRNIKRLQDHPHSIPNNTGRVYTEEAIEIRRKASATRVGKFRWITDGTTSTQMLKTAQLPVGWRFGKHPPPPQNRTAAQRMQVSNHPNIRGVICYTDGTTNLKLQPNIDPPIGFWAGMTQKKRDKQWITNGTESKTIGRLAEIPTGWKLGRTIKHIDKLLAAAAAARAKTLTSAQNTTNE